MDAPGTIARFSDVAPTRRTVLKAGGAGFGLWFVGSIGGTSYAVEATLEDEDFDILPSQGIRKWAAPLVIPPAMPLAGTLRLKGGRNADLYDIALRQNVQQILPPENGATTVWGYGPATAVGRRAATVFHAPSATIETKSGRPVRIRWRNELVGDDGHYLPHLLPVDPTLHWANPAGGTMGRDSRPSFEATPGPYDGPVPAVTHVHGAAGVGDESDGYPEAWYLPADAGVPAGYAEVGTWYDYFKAKAAAALGITWPAGSVIAQYPNSQRAGTLWYHDHTLGMTRTNVYAGPAGFYIVRGGPDGDKAVLDSRTGLPAVLPGPAPQDGDGFDPAKKTYYEIPLAIQDRTFTNDGELFYPDTRAYFDKEIKEKYLPESDVPPIWNPEFFGTSIMVNGRTWPFHTFEQRRYRLRLLNGCNSRFLILDFSGIPGAQVSQIGTEGGFLAVPVDLTATGGRLLLAPAERADVVLDLTNVPTGSYELLNVGPDEPFGGGVPGVDFDEADPLSTGRVLRLDVVPALTADASTPVQFLQLPAIASVVPVVTRSLALVEEMSMDYPDTPIAAVLATVTGNTWTTRAWADVVTENPAVGVAEMWEIYNTTADAHPIHIHEALFQVVDRQPITFDEETRHVEAVDTPRPPEPNEDGWKDTVTAYPGEVTRVRLQFERAGQYVWHCHIVEHEDNEMMRPFRIGPADPTAPTHMATHA
ncbi:multicopper oxidase family protein [Actinotalea sp. Marseille-Q4924]|uniref:multicopper oxidase family protein n=1 Tax=Actinotalea sp. Marseille-Q4924 TaxID=2866571 RepID=UPI001CE498B2|nr:multicopper oxidase [Actinotalea sp. Marseille-Q4924]